MFQQKINMRVRQLPVVKKSTLIIGVVLKSSGEYPIVALLLLHDESGDRGEYPIIALFEIVTDQLARVLSTPTLSSSFF